MDERFRAGGSLSLAELIDSVGAGAVYRDLWHHERIDLRDVIAGHGPPPSLVIALCEGIPTDDSMIFAQHQGGMEHFGWGTNRHAQADIFDALMLNTRASGNWSKKPPKLPEASRPGKGQKAPRKKRSLSEIVGEFTATGR